MQQPPVEAARRLHLVLAAAEGTVSLEDLISSQLWRMTDLWTLIERARETGLIAVDPAHPGQFRWAGDAPLRAEALHAATDEDLAALLAHRPFPDLLLAGARAAARRRDFAGAGALYRGVDAVADRELFADGDAAWLAAVLESVRMFRSTFAIAPELLDKAIGVAESAGDRAGLAVFQAARGLQILGFDPERSKALFARALETADALARPDLAAEVRVYEAISLVFAGRLREGIAACEQMMGNIPGDPFASADAWDPLLELDGPSPGAAVAVLGFGYALAGDFPRALDLLQRMTAFGAEIGNPELESEGRLYLAMAYLQSGNAVAAEPHASDAYRFWNGRGTEPIHEWNAIWVNACVRAARGHLDEARQLLEQALRARRAARNPLMFTPAQLLLLEQLESDRLPLPDGYDLGEEIDRLVADVSPVTRGLGHHFRARRLLRQRPGSPEARRAAAEDFEKSFAFLRSAGAQHLLFLALQDAAEQADREERPADAAQLRGAAADSWHGALAGDSRGSGAPERSATELRLAAALLDLGQLDALTPRASAMWGELAARLSRDFGAERCAMVELQSAPDGLTLLSARGGARWQEALLAHLRRTMPAMTTFAPALPEASPAPSPSSSSPPAPAAGASSDSSAAPAQPGQLVVIPFCTPRLARHGFVALENRLTAPWVGPGDTALLEGLGRQVGILVQNAAIWQELVATRERLEQENRYYRQVTPTEPTSGRLFVGSAAMRATLDLVARVAPTDTPVLVTGETGVGKELVSREIHLQSRRRDGPLIVVHVAALAPGLVASALFGHERGAFTGATEQVKGRFELADEGTIFLDEIGELQADDQVRLLRVLQEGTFERVGGSRVIRSDFRLVAATNRDLAAEVAAGRFREDLFFRLTAFPVRVPPLRERREEIPMLALFFMEREGRKRGVRFEGIAEADMARLVDFPWPGNVRELEHLIERAALLSDPPRLRIPELEAPTRLATADAVAAAAAAAGPSSPLPQEDWITMEEAERRYIRRVLRHVGGRITGAGGAAELLGMNPSTLQFRIGKLGLKDDLAQARALRPRRA